MKNCFLISMAMLLLFSCNNTPSQKGAFVQNIDELNTAISQATPGGEIILKNGTWKDVQIKFFGEGTEGSPITLRAETPGEVFIEGQSFVHLGGKHLIVDGLYFRNGYSPGNGVVNYRIGRDSIAFHCQVTNCVIEGFTRPNRWETDRWVEFYGKHNTLDHCYITGKSNDGATVIVFQKGNKHTNNYHQIVNNYFGPRPRKGGPHGETMRIGGSETSMTPGHVNVSNNYFEACNGEVEIISDKTNFNTFTNNIFYKCEGSLVMRHSNYTTVDGNMFIGADDSDFYGGVRVVNTGHWITNNYFYKIRGGEFRSPIAVMNGIPKSPLNRYLQVTDAVVAFNTLIDCKSPIQIGVGQNKASADVLPKREIRSAPPIRTTIANNIIYNTTPDAAPVVNHDDMSGILFKQNVLDNGGQEFAENGVFRNEKISMKQVNDWLFAPEAGQSTLSGDVYAGFEFDKISKDLFGTTRAKSNQVGAISQLASAEKFSIDKKKYGPSWFMPNKAAGEPQVLVAPSTEGGLASTIGKAQSGDIIELSNETYTIGASLKIDKDITIRAKETGKATLLYAGKENTPAFEMNPGGVIRLQGLSLKGQNKQSAFSPLAENMSSAYNLFVEDCVIEDFVQVLEASRGSFADSINFSKTTIKNCESGFVLAAEKKGDYNAEMVSFDQCEFQNIQRNAIHFYRGGYDESTIGGFLTISNCTFTACGKKEASGTLLKTTGIINVLISDNTFQNNPVKLVAVLWGAKNNHHRNNTITRSGSIEVVEQQKQELMY
ncbi:MAG: chondroitinase-B domain-containing protein [Bacteroidia bacterium]